MNLWILTEERPKKPVIEMIVCKLAEDKNLYVEVSALRIIPILKRDQHTSLLSENMKQNTFTFMYQVLGINVETIENIYLKIISGESSFVDYLIFVQENEPDSKSEPLYAIEETKTADIESRNTGVYQRCTKFVFIDFYYPTCKKIMLYNIQFLSNDNPTETNIFGTRMLLTIGVEILGKTFDKTIFMPFNNVEELISFKDNMRSAPTGNVPIEIRKFNDRIEVSGRLYKSGGLSHDPNIGALSIICKALRVLGWTKDIIITKHGLSQNHLTSRNKFIRIANKINVKLYGLTIPHSTLPLEYWHYEKQSEKVVTIFLHLILLDTGFSVIYENHAGCERGYFIPNRGDPFAIHKYIENDKSLGILNLPDLIVRDDSRKHILIIEGKKLENLSLGIEEIKTFDSIEAEYIKKYYSGYEVTRHVVLFGGLNRGISDEGHVALYLNEKGEIYTSSSTPETIKDALMHLPLHP